MDVQRVAAAADLEVLDRVRTLPCAVAEEGIAASSTGKRIVAVAAVEGIVATATDEAVGGAVADQRVREIVAGAASLGVAREPQILDVSQHRLAEMKIEGYRTLYGVDAA